jgi:nitrite reductase/ring-hydroxylating ferredoxin subunit
MQKMYIKTPESYHFDHKMAIETVERHYNAKYMGYWSIKRDDGNWSEMPVDVFYQPNPDTSKGHSHYFGLFTVPGTGVMITDAKSAFSEPIIGLLTEDGEVIVSRHRHDFVSKDGFCIDGGREYTKIVGGLENVTRVEVTVENGEFLFNKIW